MLALGVFGAANDEDEKEEEEEGTAVNPYCRPVSTHRSTFTHPLDAKSTDVSTTKPWCGGGLLCCVRIRVYTRTIDCGKISQKYAAGRGVSAKRQYKSGADGKGSME
jgi:hypothetical protein